MTDMNKKNPQDEQLSDFADRVLKGQMKDTASDSNEELRSLEETVLRLHNSMPAPSFLEESAKKQMYVRLNARLRRESEKGKQKNTFGEFLFNREWLRPRFAVAGGVIALLIAVIILSPKQGSMDSSTTVGTALTQTGIIPLVLVIAGLIIIVFLSKWKK